MTERWLPVVGFEGLYEVSDHGRVRSVDRVAVYLRTDQYSGRALTISRRHRGKILAPGTMESGHKIVILGRGHPKLVHALILAAFVGPRPPGLDSLHGDGDPANNRLGNLRWGTRKENVEDTRRHGRMLMGDGHPMSKLTAADIPVIRRLLRTRPMSEIAETYGVNRSVIRQVKIGYSWKHVPLEAA